MCENITARVTSWYRRGTSVCEKTTARGTGWYRRGTSVCERQRLGVQASIVPQCVKRQGQGHRLV